MSDELGHVIWPFAVEASPNEKFTAIPFDFSLSANETKTLTFNISTGFDFVLSILNSYSTDAFTLQIRDEKNYQDLFISKSGEKPRASTVTGNGQNPFLLPKAHRFGNGTSIEVTVTDLSGSANTVELVLIGYKDTLTKERLVQLQAQGADMSRLGAIVPGRQPRIKVDGDTYLIDRLTTIVADFTVDGGTYDFKYPISTGSSFMWEILNGTRVITPDRDYTLQIRDELINEDFFTSALRSDTLVGNGQNPFVLPRPYLFQGGTNILITVSDTETSPANASTVQIAMVGYKVKRL